jgi:hypothetical protein
LIAGGTLDALPHSILIDVYTKNLLVEILADLGWLVNYGFKVEMSIFEMEGNFHEAMD